MDYLEPGAEFADLPRKPEPPSYMRDPVECPKCKGRGVWVLQLDAYGKGQHFTQMCGACWSWGWVERGECLHEWRSGRNVGRCMNQWICTLCEAVRVVDSSD